MDIEVLLDKLAPNDDRSAWIQLFIIATCALAALVAHLLARRVDMQQLAITRAIQAWPVGLIVLTVGIWVAYVGVLGFGMDAGWLHLVAIAATLCLAAGTALKVIGSTVLGWLAVGLAVVVATLEVLGLTQPTIAALDARGVLLGGLRITPWFVFKTIAVVGGLFWASQSLSDVADRSIRAEQVLSRSGRVLLAKLVRAGLLAFAIFLSLAFLGVNIATLAVLSGAIGLGLGFGLQKIVSNYVSGLILLLDRSVKPGDVIEVEFGEGRIRGEVTELAGRYTAITLRTGVETLIPNEVLISNPVSNWSHTSPNVQVRIPVGVAYSTDVQKAILLCKEAALAAPRVLATPEPVCLILGFGDSAVELDVRFWIADAELGVRNVSSGVYLEIWKRFQACGIEIPFPQRDVHIRSNFTANAGVIATGD